MPGLSTLPGHISPADQRPRLSVQSAIRPAPNKESALARSDSSQTGRSEPLPELDRRSKEIPLFPVLAAQPSIHLQRSNIPRKRPSSAQCFSARHSTLPSRELYLARARQTRCHLPFLRPRPRNTHHEKQPTEF